jgi:hypothetical protein
LPPGFAFDIYELLMLPLIVKPALASLGGMGVVTDCLFSSGSVAYTQWARPVFSPAILAACSIVWRWLT